VTAEAAELQPAARRVQWPLLAALLVCLAALATVAPAPVPSAPTWADRTGPAPGTLFTTVWGDLEVVNAGTIIDSADVHGKVIVLAPNVTIRNSIIRGGDGGSVGGLIDAMAGKRNLRVIDTEIVATAPSPRINGVMGSNFTLDRVEIHGVIDHVHIVGNDVTVVDSWLHDNLHYDIDPAHKGGPSHDDNVQIQNGHRITIAHNLMTGSHNAVMQITQDRGAVSDVRFSGNHVDGGWCSINVSEGDWGPISGIALGANEFGRSMRLPECAIIAPRTTELALSRNRFDDGGVITIRPGGKS
jgi:hypothetical protein